MEEFEWTVLLLSRCSVCLANSSLPVNAVGAAEARGLINAQVCRAKRKIIALIALQRGPGALTVCDSTDALF